MRRVVSLYLPTWSTDRLRRRLGPDSPSPETPLVLVGRQGRKRLVLAADPAALAHRLHPGMAATQARALVGDLVVHDFDPAGDASALDQLALWALRRYAPIVAADPPDGLVLDVTGATHRYGGDQALLDDLIAQTTSVGLNARAALADTWASAHALARHLALPSLTVERGGPALSDLPPRALRLPPDMVEGLGRLGVDTIGELEARPRAPLALRFGPELTRRLDQAYGRAAEPITPIDTPDLVQVRRVFAEPIGAPETLARYTLKLVEALCVDLEAKGLGATRLDLRFERVDNRTEAIRVGTARPVRDVKRLTRLLCDKIETVDPGLGVEAMSLAAPIALPLDWAPIAGDLTGPAAPEIGDLVDLLANRLGPQRLYRLAPAQSDVPERSTRKLPPTAPPVTETWPRRWPRPSRLLDRPEAIEAVALLPDQPPVAFTWRRIRHRVRRADGPERIFGEWWRRDGERDAVRDYFQLEDEAGARFWVYRRGDGEQAHTGDLTWWLHGLFG
ncbi:Y-family DNA polymerase [Brevundimonas nasdae]|uniref:DNA polymerase Y family protein n=1 Tax=Brevundimonas nasdae TaxID=172043 RepID=A0ABX8TL14_9CAUL|nr:DNA polymerase Y family protein [Brevundimonas nasdae]QYC11478.1 DNA polymerase Y family protein [Brevundimonas nasdae]QYC14266.1 DNA polymerase Y family protein [Brevundimonas nasdae]